MKESIKLIRENIILITIGLNLLSLLHLYAYYLQYKIPIVFYLDLSEILLTGFTFLIKEITFGILIYTMLYKAVLCEWLEKEVLRTMVMTIIILIICVITPRYILDIPTEINHMIAISFMFSLNFILIDKYIRHLRKSKIEAFKAIGRETNQTFNIKTQFFPIMVVVGLYPVLGAQNARQKRDDFNKTCVEKPCIDSLYIGESRSHIFYYKPKDSSSVGIEKSKLKSIKFDNKLTF